LRGNSAAIVVTGGLPTSKPIPGKRQFFPTRKGKGEGGRDSIRLARSLTIAEVGSPGGKIRKLNRGRRRRLAPANRAWYFWISEQETKGKLAGLYQQQIWNREDLSGLADITTKDMLAWWQH